MDLKPYFNYRKRILDHVDAIISISENTKDLIDIYNINETRYILSIWV